MMTTVGIFTPSTPTTYAMHSRYEVPVPSNSFDVVLAGQVIEHVEKVWQWTEELARAIRPGGRLILISPISWPFHEAPVDCWRIYPDGMRTLCSHAQLVVELCEQAALEPRRSRRSYFAESWETTRPRGWSYAVRDLAKTVLGWPMPTALDLVTIAVKPAPPVTPST